MNEEHIRLLGKVAIAQYSEELKKDIAFAIGKTYPEISNDEIDGYPDKKLQNLYVVGSVLVVFMHYAPRGDWESIRDKLIESYEDLKDIVLNMSEKMFMEYVRYGVGINKLRI